MPDIAIPADQFDALADALGDDFDFDGQLLLMERCYGEKRINEVAARGDPTRKIAALCLRETERTGDTRAYLSLVMASMRSNAPLRGMITRIAPELDGQRADTRAQVEIVVDRLQRTRAAVQQQPVRDVLVASRGVLSGISSVVRMLETYKNLHDNLHQLQVRNFADLRLAAQAMDKDPDQLVKLVEFHEQARIACTLARPEAQRLSAGSLELANEISWIDKMEEATAELGTAVEELQHAPARLALGRIWRIVEREPSRINRQIFLIAQNLQLAGLEKVFRDTAALQPDGSDAEQACAALRELGVTLLGHAVDHTRWQEVDDSLWILDKVFEFRSDDPSDDFYQDWPATRDQARIMALAEPGAVWSVKLIKCMDRVGDEQVRLEALAGAEDTTPRQLFRLYDGFRREARFRFFVVDLALKTNCAALARLAEPLQDIVKVI
jgi:hypothetical protein